MVVVAMAAEYAVCCKARGNDTEVESHESRTNRMCIDERESGPVIIAIRARRASRILGIGIIITVRRPNANIEENAHR